MKQWIFALALVSLIPSVAFAINLNLNYPEFGGFNLKDDQSLQGIVAFFYYLIVGIAGLAAFVMLVWGGVQWLLSGAIPSQANEARDKVRNAIVGLPNYSADIMKFIPNKRNSARSSKQYAPLCEDETLYPHNRFISILNHGV